MDKNNISKKSMHPVEILDIFRNNYEKDIFLNLPYETIAEIINEAKNQEKLEILNLFNEEEQKNILMYVSSDEVTELMRLLDAKEKFNLLDKMDDEFAEDVLKLLMYEADTAGGIMATEYISIQEDMTIKDTLKYLQKVAPDAETAYYIYIVDNENKLKGVVSLREIVIHTFDVPVINIANTNVVSLKYNTQKIEIKYIFQKYGFFTIPVIDDDNKILGIVTADDVINLLRDEHTKEVHRLGGINEEETVDGTLIKSIKSRMPWLLLNLITAFLASSVVALFQNTLDLVLALTIYMPIISGMGGNAGAQTLTLIIRGIALGELKIENYKRILIKEIIVGLIIGSFIGLIVSIISFITTKKIIFGLVVFISMVLNIVIASISGFLVPVILKKLKIDPALASSVFVTTATDTFGFLFLLGLSTIFIKFI